MKERAPLVAIVGGGFSGMLTAIHVIRAATSPLCVTIINSGEKFGRGIAFSPYSDTHLLNVMAGKMSAFPEDPDNFVNWLLSNETYKKIGKDLVSKTYLPRSLYGRYLDSVWKAAIDAKPDFITVHVIEDEVVDIIKGDNFILNLKAGKQLSADHVVLATGNSTPGSPKIANSDFYKSPNYFVNPWSKATVRGLRSSHDVLIIGNGLTMVDTVLGLREAGFTKNIYSISPDGFSILQHRHNGLSYPSMMEELKAPYHLYELVQLFNKHRKAIRTLGLSAEPVIDSLRPVTQTVWMALSVSEKKAFMSRLRHMWGVARHRLPIHVHDLIVRMKLDGKLMVRAGKLLNIRESADAITVEFYNKKTRSTESIVVERVINCTGPEADIHRSSNGLLSRLANNGLLASDPLNLGAMANPDTYEAIDRSGTNVDSLYLIGTILRGLLWESTAVPEIRGQAKKIGDHIVGRLNSLNKEPGRLKVVS